MPTVKSGVRTQDQTGGNLNKRDVYETIYYFDPYQTPITQFFLANKTAKRKVGNPKFELQEDVLVPHTDTVNDASGIAGGGTTDTVTMSNGAYFIARQVWRVTTTDENLRVTSVSSNDVSFTKVGSGNITAAANGVTLILVGTAHPEASASATALWTQSTFPFNYVQSFKRAVHMSDIQQATDNYGGNDWINQRMKATKEFKLDLERAWIFGIRDLVAAAGGVNQIFITGGMIDQTSGAVGITDKSQYVGDDFATEDYFFKTYCKNLFAKGSNTKTLYCGADSLLAINDFSKVKLQTKVAEVEYGVDVQTVLTPFGRAKLIWHPILENEYSNWVIGVDSEDYMAYSYLAANGKNLDMKYVDDIGTVDVDERKAEYRAVIGLHLSGGTQGYHRILYPGASA